MEKIVVSGGSRGIGKALVENLVRQGNTVFAFARSKEGLDDLQRSVSGARGTLFTFVFDLESEDLSPLISELKWQLGKVTRLVNNAGTLVNKPFLELSREEVEHIFRVNVLSVFPLVQQLVPLMPARSHIVNLTSMGGFQGSTKFPGLSAYSAAKGALSVLTESLAVELSELNISVNALALGAVQTEMLADAFPGYQAPVSPDEMAQFIADFTLSGHRYFNGKILPVSLSSP